MEPQLHVGDRVVVSKLAYRFHDPRRGDIVVFDSPEPHATAHDSLPISVVKDVLEGVGLRQPDEDILIKRVIGLPGELVEGRDGHVYVNGQRLVEPYLQDSVTTDAFLPRQLGPDELWVMGDNRGNSRDSHVFGPIKTSSVIGRAVNKVWPPGDASFL
jgi:signal peptidase I